MPRRRTFRLLAKVEQKNVGEWTKLDYKKIIKCFYKWLILLVVGIVLISGRTESRKVSDATVSGNVASANNNFGIKLFKALSKNESGNIFISPTSIDLDFYMLHNGAVGKTKDDMEKTLEIQGINVNELNEGSKNFTDILTNTEPKIELSNASSIWVRNGFNLVPEFVSKNEKYYSATVKSIDFSGNGADVINNWVDEKTRGKIKKIVNSGELSHPLMLMALLNAIYFKGQWTTQFDKKLTSDGEFTFADGGKEALPMMRRESTTYPDWFPYLETSDFQAISLSYGDNETFSMYVFLPKTTLEQFVESLNSTNWDYWMSKFVPKPGTIIMPRFRMEYEKDFNDVLKALGMEIGFTSSADFSKAVEGSMFITLVRHKTFVEVNEEGTEAAAVTELGELTGPGFWGPPPEKFYMNVNHPFFFTIVNTKSKAILFMGAVQKRFQKEASNRYNLLHNQPNRMR